MGVDAAVNTQREILEPPEGGDDGARPDTEPDHLLGGRTGRRGEEEVVQHMAGEQNCKVQRGQLMRVSAVYPSMARTLT